MRSQRTFQQMRPAAQMQQMQQQGRPQMAPPLRAGPPPMPQHGAQPMPQFNQAQQGQMQQFGAGQQASLPAMQPQQMQQVAPQLLPQQLGPTGAPGIMAPPLRRTY